MARVVATCGRICSGKTTYAQRLRLENSAVVLSVDEIMLSLFVEGLGDKHDEYVERVKSMLLDKSLELVEVGIDVILDGGLWTKSERQYIKEFYSSKGVACEVHYLDISDELWQQRLDERNALVLEGKTSAYYVDDGLAKKFSTIFEKPTSDEIDVLVSL